MKTRLLMVVISLMMVSTALGQSKFNLSGIVMEKGSNEPIMSATVQVCTVKDTTLVDGAATDVKGAFKINGVKKGQYLLKISFIGYHTHVVPVNLNNEKKKDVDLGYFTLTTDAIMLKEAQVTANAAKVQVKGDSLIYNADAYRMYEGSMLEDLVKKLPGATIDEDGTIKINGKEVKKVLVDGKEFFINDKNIALKNLPTNIIDKIKAYDRKSDLSRITGIDDGEDETVLDLTVKKGMNNGWFGQINGGLGTERRYNARANVNRFNGPNQYSLVSSANNVNDRGFGGGGGRGFGGRGFGGGGGLQASKELGFNFASELSEKLEAGGYVWHRYNGSDSWNQSTTQNFVMPSGAFSNSVNQSYTSNSNLSSGFRFEWKPDSMWNIIFRPNFSYSRNRSSQYGTSRTYDVDPNDYTDATLEKAERNFISHVYETGDAYVDTLITKIVNTNDSRSQNYSNSVGGNGELQINRKLNTNGRNITLRLTGGLTNTESRQLSAANISYRQGKPGDINNRYNTTPGRTRNYSVQATYSEPIADRTYIQFSYRFSYSYNKSDRQAYDYLSNLDSYNAIVEALSKNRYDIAGAVDDLLSRGFTQTYSERLSQFSEYKNLDHTISLTFRRVRDNYNFNFGFDLLPQHSEMDYHYMGKQYNDITRNVFNFAPSLNLRYRFNEMSNLQFRYRARTSQPSMTNLLDIEDDSNPLNITKGNPGLKPSFNQNFMLFYNTFEMEHQRSIFANLNFSFTQNQIAQRVYIIDASKGQRMTKSENINGNWNVNGGFGFNTALDANKAWTLNSNTDAGFQNSVSYLDPAQYREEKSTTKTLNLRERLELGYRNDWFEISLNGNVNFNHSNNNVITNSLKNTFDFAYGTEININAPWGTMFNTDIAMNSRRGYASSEMNTNELIWNAQVSQSFLRGRALTISLSWNDILGQQSNISRTINAMQSSDTRYNAIYSYGMINVIYKLNIFGGRNANGTSNERDMWGRTSGERGNRGGRPGGGRPGGGRPGGGFGGGFGGGRPF